MQKDECRMKCRARERRPLVVFCLPSVFCVGLVLAGCGGHTSTTQPASRPATVRERQDRALKDPFGYSPEVDRTDISGGGLSGFDKDGFRKDMKNVWDP